MRASDGALTVMVVNKNLFDPSNPSATTPITINLSNFAAAGAAQEWQLAAVSPSDQTKAAISRLSDLHFTGNSLAIGGTESAICAFGSNGNRTSEHRNDVAESGIGDLKASLERIGVGDELGVLAGLIVITDERGHGGGIVGDAVHVAPGGKLLGGRIHVLLALLNGGEQVGQKVGVESDGHNELTGEC